MPGMVVGKPKVWDSRLNKWVDQGTENKQPGSLARYDNQGNPYYYQGIQDNGGNNLEFSTSPSASNGPTPMPALSGLGNIGASLNLGGGGGAVSQPQAPPKVQQAPTPAPIPQIDVNSILNQWNSISKPPLAREAEIPYIDDTAAAQAAYNRAKDTAGQQGRGALDALMDVQGARGIVGSGLGVNEAGGVIGAVNQNLADVNRERMIQAYETELARQTANAANRVTQRGQDITQQGQNNAILNSLIDAAGLKQSGALTQRGQDIDLNLGNLNAGIDQRGQDISVMNNTLDNSTTQRGQNLNMLEALMKLYPQQLKQFNLG